MTRFVVTAMVVVASIAARPQTPKPRVGVSLFSAFMSPADVSAPPIALTLVAPDVRRAIEARLATRRAYRSELVFSKTPNSPLEVVQRERGNLDGFLVALSGSGARTEAVSYARSAKLYYEWEGYADPPIGEAAWAEGYLREHPRSALKLALNLFLLQRYRSGFEAAIYEMDRPPGEIVTRDRWNAEQERYRSTAASRYQDAWNRLRSTSDVVIRAVADDLDEQAFLYLNAGGQHPRRSK